MDKQFQLMVELRQFAAAPPAPQFFGNAGREHMDRYGTTAEQFAKIGWKNHKHSVNNPYSQFQTEYSLQQILDAPMVYDPLTKLQCCPTSDGAAAAILASEDFVRQHNLQGQAIEILGMAMTSDFRSTLDDKSCIKLIGSDMTKEAARKVYQQSGFGPENVDVVELHDCFSCNEMITYEALGLCPEGQGGAWVDAAANTYGGQVVVNPSGGLISKGHPLGATGLAQCSELTWQLRGQADKRQVKDAKIALQHNLGLGGAAVVAMYRKADLA
jgi:acetyl-CoA acetyltransferase